MRHTLRSVSEPAWGLLVAASLLASGGVALAGSQEGPLPRRAWLGAALEAVEGGVRVRSLFAGSPAEAGGLRRDDVLKTFDGRPIGPLPALLRGLKLVPAGTEVAFEIERDGQAQTVKFPLTEWPREADTARYRVQYESVPSPAGRLRTITYVPSNASVERSPALLIIQGLSAVTLDNAPPGVPLDQPVGMGVYRTIAAGLADAGFVVMMVDKAGCGDSAGDATRLDFEGERDGFRSALQALKARSDVDPDRVLLFGHSMGGVIGPLIAAEVPVRGLAVYGTALKTWFEYLLENERRQYTLAGADLAAFDRVARQSERFYHEFLVAKRRPSDVFDQHPDLGRAAANFSVDGDLVFGRHYTFFQQLADVNLPEAWGRLDAHVLALWGESDFVSGHDDHEQIAALVEARHPNHGRFEVLPESDHGFARYKSPQAIMQARATGAAPAPFNPAIVGVLKTWAREQTR